MTALAGFWSFGTAGDAAPRCARMLRAQGVYGPDGSAVRADGGIALGRTIYRRLPEDAYDRGPVVGPDGSLLVADLRLDNREELADELGLARPDAARLSDTALLARALACWGEDTPGRLLGVFAFAWWTGEHLLLARDFLGHRPLHYFVGDGFFALASMAKGLHALPEIPYAADEQAMAEFVALLPENGTRTFFAGIHKVPQGHLVAVTPDGINTRRWWQPATKPLRLPRPEDYHEALRAELDRAVRAQMRGAETVVAAHLSAGLDSSAVCATAARLTAGRVIGITSVPRGGYAHHPVRGSIPDEGPLAAATARLYSNIEHVTVEAGTYHPLADIDRMFLLFERPVLNLVNVGWSNATLEAARSHGCQVLLSGAFGNHSISFGGMQALAGWLARGRLLRLARESVALKRRGTRLGTIASQTLGPFLPPPVWKLIERLRGRGRELTDFTMIRPEAAGRVRPWDFRPRLDPLSARLEQIGRVDYGNYMKGQLAGWGIDMRDPTADRRLVEFCLSVPAEQFVQGGTTRALARGAFADRLPPEVVGEVRKGYQAADWHEGMAAARADIAEEVRRIASAPGAGELIDLGRMSQMLEQWPEGGWHRPDVFIPYRVALLRGVSAGHFLRKAAGTNA
jgi:asparagine synthase (glutamine-hydrolysing)